MTNQELVEEANRRYPPGTVYHNLNMIGEKSIPDCPLDELPIAPSDKRFDIMKHTYASNSVIIGINGYGWVYANHKWAEIESLPIINNYQIY